MIKNFLSLLFVFLLSISSSCSLSNLRAKQGNIAESFRKENLSNNISLDVKENCELVVTDVVDLKGGIVDLPNNVLITFKKNGKIVNGILRGNNTRVRSVHEGAFGVVLNGTWCVDRIKDDFFSCSNLTNDQIIHNLCIMQSDDIYNEVMIDRDYEVSIPWAGGSGLRMSSNSSLLLNATLKLLPNNFKSYNIVQIKGKKNVKIQGGKIVGDVGKHAYVKGSTSEWGVGVDIEESEKVELSNIYITKCTGDGIYISGGFETKIGNYDHSSKNILISNVISDDNRRQGLSIIHVDGLVVRDSYFINTGQTESIAPSAGIDIEPNVTNNRNMSVRNVIIENCSITNNKGMAIANSVSFEYEGHINHENILYKNCKTDGLLKCASDDVTFRNCSFKDVWIASAFVPTHIFFENCSIYGGKGITLQIPSSPNVQSRNRLLSLTFKNCYLTMNVEAANTISLINCSKAHVQNLNFITIENCRILIPKLKNKNNSLTNVSFAGKLYITSSEIFMNGYVFDAQDINLRNNIIHCRSALGMPKNSFNKILLDNNK